MSGISSFVDWLGKGVLIPKGVTLDYFFILQITRVKDPSLKKQTNEVMIEHWVYETDLADIVRDKHQNFTIYFFGRTTNDRH